MARQYIVTVPGHGTRVARNASKAADMIIGKPKGKGREKGPVVSQLAAMYPGDTLLLEDGTQVEVVGVEEKEDDDGGGVSPATP